MCTIILRHTVYEHTTPKQGQKQEAAWAGLYRLLQDLENTKFSAKF